MSSNTAIGPKVAFESHLPLLKPFFQPELGKLLNEVVHAIFDLLDITLKGIPLRVSSHYIEWYMLFFHIPQFAYPRCLPFWHQAVYLSSATIASRRATSSSVNSGKCPLFAFDNEPPFCCTKRINRFAFFSGISTTLRIPNLMRS